MIFQISAKIEDFSNLCKKMIFQNLQKLMIFQILPNDENGNNTSSSGPPRVILGWCAHFCISTKVRTWSNMPFGVVLQYYTA